MDKFVYFTHISIYFRPVKRSVPLRKYNGSDIFLSRFSVDIGMTMNSISEENKISGFSFQEDKDKDKGLMFGCGFRILPFAKINAGTMIYQLKNIIPLANRIFFTAGVNCPPIPNPVL